MKNKKVTFFDVLNSIINKKEINEDEVKKQFNKFVAIHWLSSNPAGLLVGNYLNSYRGSSKIDNLTSYKFLKNAIKLPRNTFIKMEKKSEEYKKIAEYVEIISKFYKIGENTAREYLKILPEEELNKIVKKFQNKGKI